ncbi:MAG: hypothetical protein OEV94_00545 [Deltaproteobacteria bacterium]|nr:hypothetical protein [Deltaproteobacteria bacterium]
MDMKPARWQGEWYEEGLSEQFFQDMARLEKQGLGGTPGQWLAQITAETGLLAQHLSPLMEGAADLHRMKLAHDKAVRLAALGAQLAGALAQAQRQAAKPQRRDGVGSYPAALEKVLEEAVAQARQDSSEAHGSQTPSVGQSMAPSMGQTVNPPGAQPGAQPTREMIHSLSRRGLPVAEIEVITGQPKRVIQAVLAGY